MNVIFFEVDGILNFVGSDAKAPDKTLGISEARVKKLKKILENRGAKPVLYGAWKKDWNFDDSLCSPNGIYLNKKLDRRGIHILDKTRDGESPEAEIQDWLQRHPNVEDYLILKEGDMNDE